MSGVGALGSAPMWTIINLAVALAAHCDSNDAREMVVIDQHRRVNPVAGTAVAESLDKLGKRVRQRADDPGARCRVTPWGPSSDVRQSAVKRQI